MKVLLRICDVALQLVDVEPFNASTGVGAIECISTVVIGNLEAVTTTSLDLDFLDVTDGIETECDSTGVDCECGVSVHQSEDCGSGLFVHCFSPKRT